MSDTDSEKDLETGAEENGAGVVVEALPDGEFERLVARVAKVQPAADILCLGAFLAPQLLDLCLLRKTEKVLPDRLRSALADEDAMERSAALLCEEGLATDATTLSLSADVQKRFRRKLSRSLREEWAGVAVGFVLKAFPVQLKYEQRIAECDALVEHGLVAVDWAARYGVVPANAGDLGHALGLYLHGCGDFPRARDCLHRSLVLSQKELGERNPKLATRWNNLGVVHQDLDAFPDARVCFGNAVNLLMGHGGARDEAVVQPLRNLYLVLVVLEDWEAAKGVAEKALKVFLDMYDFEHPYVGECLSQLGTVSHRLNDKESARRHFDRAVLSVSCAQPFSAGDLALCKRNYGSMLLESGDFKDAEGELRGALDLSRSVFEDKHISVAFDLTELGRALVGQANYEEAEARFKEGLSVCRALEGAGSLNQLPILKHLYELFKLLDNHRGICVCLARELSIKELKFGEGAPQLARGLIRLGRALERRQKHGEAEDALRRALRIHKEHGNLSLSDEANAHQYLGRVLEAQDRVEEALLHFEESLDIREESLGLTDMKVGRDSLHVGRLLVEAGQRLKGLGRLATAVRLYEGHLGTSHPKSIEIREEHQRIKKREV